MDYPIKHYSINGSNLALVFIFFAGVLYLSFWSSSLTNFPILFSSQNKDLQFQLLPNSPAIEEAEATPLARDELEAALSKASMENNNNNNNNKTVIIAVINRAYADQDIYMKADTTMLDIFLDSFWLGENTRALRDHLLLVAVDQTAYDRCRFLKLNCYRLETDGVDFRGEKLYMSADFVKMMWRRTLFLLEVLKRGYSFIFTVCTNYF
ncbi:hypothetical protein L484_000628 [Morus notabilis]|uniref:Nucleotide-diphospho-sugar transferase domain-containing protein n=1 Tax=Morus notabilis TaxID=981085 RepID=W9SLY2_9ROSA|nr:hypothetical protein L484_000628 [Morus notabilis]